MKNNEHEELESWLKDRADNYMLYPSERVWSNIQRRLHPGRDWIALTVLLTLFMTATTFVALRKEEKQSAVPLAPGTMAYVLTKENPLSAVLPSPPAIGARHFKTANPIVVSNKANPAIAQVDGIAGLAMGVSDNRMDITAPASIAFPVTVLNPQPKKKKIKPAEKKSIIGSAFENAVWQAKKWSKNVSFQYYITPTIGYRSLNGVATGGNYPYSQYFLTTNNVFGKNVKDVVDHRAGLGLELGTAMLYPLSKKLTLKAGIQGNYNNYIIKAYHSFPEVATLGMNNLGYGSYPINSLSYYRNSNGYGKATLRNEHYMLSIPIGLDYRVAGNKALNFTVGSTLQPTFVFANYSYLLSSNLRNYAKAPSLNKRWNLNASVEASIQFVKGTYTWSIGPQYRYQLLSSFKDKYPIRENLTDFGIKLGMVKTLH